MKIGYNWLRELVAVDSSPEELGEALTMLGFPVQSVERASPVYPGVCTGQVMSVAKHPRADKVVVCEVSAGVETFRVVCGAPNVREGMKVALACPGSTLPDGKRIEAVTIRGETSHGMMCSGRELGLSDDAAGILDLPKETAVGVSLDEHLGVGETVIELEVSHNRPDCLSVLGIAREVSALTGVPLVFPTPELASEQAGQEERVRVEVESPNDCARYCGLVVSGVRAGRSPLWLERRLEIAGFRALNSLVDCTNYCLATFGQPIHAFDLDRMKRKSILVRRGRSGESIVTLDGVKRLVGPEVLLVTDGDSPIAIAGVMGGVETEVHDGTRRVFLESAHFSPRAVKEGSRKLGLDTEASVRFSRGSDVEIAGRCVSYVAWLISTLSGGRVRGELTDVHPARRPATRVRVDPQRISSRLGKAVPVEFMETRLSRLGFKWVERDGSVEIEVPSFRHDVNEEVDIVEEVARSFGYDNFPDRIANVSWVVGVDDDEELFLEECAGQLASLGLSEAVTRTLVDPARASAFLPPGGERELAWVANPASSAEAVMRPRLLASLLEAVSVNLRRGAESVRLFEVGKVFKSAGAPVDTERVCIAAAVCGLKRGPSWQDRQPASCDLFDIKGVLEALLGKLRVDNYRVLCYHGPEVERESSGSILCDDKTLGLFGMASREVLKKFEIEKNVFVFELDANTIRCVRSERAGFAESSRFPCVKRDLAVVVDAEFPQREVAELLRKLAGEDLRRLELFDVYAGKSIPEGKKSLAYSLSFQSLERTLSDPEVDESMRRITEGLRSRGALIRGECGAH
ncbi:MAG: phenylalanine--tRNA ligase subunit beta [Candidatus Eisenbacteria bacterium]